MQESVFCRYKWLMAWLLALPFLIQPVITVGNVSEEHTRPRRKETPALGTKDVWKKLYMALEVALKNHRIFNLLHQAHAGEPPHFYEHPPHLLDDDHYPSVMNALHDFQNKNA